MRATSSAILAFVTLFSLSTPSIAAPHCIKDRSKYVPLDCTLTKDAACPECVLWRLARDATATGSQACGVGMRGSVLGKMAAKLGCDARASQSEDECACVVEQNKAVVLDALDKEHVHFLLVPATPTRGVEAKALYEGDGPFYWDLAWKAGKAIVDEDHLGLAANSFYGRSREQLHIHIATFRDNVHAKLKTLTQFPAKINPCGHEYEVYSLPNLTGENDPFHYAEKHSACADRPSRTFVVTRGPSGFLLMVGCARGGDDHGENMLLTNKSTCD